MRQQPSQRLLRQQPLQAKLHNPTNTLQEPSKTPNIQPKIKARPTQIKLPPIKTLLPPPQQQIKKLDPITTEIAIGYIISTFSARQKEHANDTYLAPATEALSHGLDFYINSNYYLGRQRGGISLGLGVEYLPITWREPLQSLSNTKSLNKNDAIIAPYMTLGGFYDVLHAESQALRFFASVGLGVDLLRGGSYDGSVSISGDVVRFSPDVQWSLTLPLSAGARYIFATSHGLEVAVKYHPFDTKYFITTPSPFFAGFEANVLTTTISRNISFAIRYVYEFKT